MCGHRIHKVVRCDNDYDQSFAASAVYLLTCNCMSYSDSGDGVVVGACPFLCGNYWYMDINADTILCDNIHQNKQGQLCGQCKDNHSPSP